MDKYFIAKKNRYAGRKAGDDKGVPNLDFSEDGWPEVSRKMSGMEAKQTKLAPIGRNIQLQTLVVFSTVNHQEKSKIASRN
ncbi:MAG: hypothetical protein CM15mV57_020 [uncultured marine virus]|nr:MAG: hypothetical protein CM15mV57_020 [uncultured marine virus]